MRNRRGVQTLSVGNDRRIAVDDDRIWNFEESLWTADAAHYEESVDDECLMVLPSPPFVFTGQQAIDAVKDTPRWDKVSLTERQVARPHLLAARDMALFHELRQEALARASRL